MSSANSGGRALALAVWALAAIVVALAFSREWFPALASAHGAGVDRMLRFTMITTGAMILAGHVILGYMLWRFGGRRRAASGMASERTQRNWSLAAAAFMALVAEGGVHRHRLAGLDRILRRHRPRRRDSSSKSPRSSSCGTSATPAPTASSAAPTRSSLTTPRNPLGLDPADPQAAKDDIVDAQRAPRPFGRTPSTSACIRRTSFTASSCPTSA